MSIVLKHVCVYNFLFTSYTYCGYYKIWQFISPSVSNFAATTIVWEHFVLQNFHALIFCVGKFSYKWTYGIKNCRSAIIVNMWVLIRLLLFCLAGNRDSEAILIPIIIIVVTLLAIRSNRWSDIYLVTSLLSRVIAFECRHRDKGPLGSERPFLGFK